ncbi:hypothetical protein J4G02_18900 [Candidatus Poribacteria bacterium]|nr:hypothetical protein [Candidatus Poribacteria bacterium]
MRVQTGDESPDYQPETGGPKALWYHIIDITLEINRASLIRVIPESVTIRDSENEEITIVK